MLLGKPIQSKSDMIVCMTCHLLTRLTLQAVATADTTAYTDVPWAAPSTTAATSPRHTTTMYLFLTSCSALITLGFLLAIE